MTAQETCKARYSRYESNRDAFLRRARQCSELTIPTLIPMSGHSSSTVYPTPWQGIGARGVNNLAAKLLLSLLPPNSPFFRLTVDSFTSDKLTGDPTKKATVESGLARIERAVQMEIEGSGFRAPIFEGLKHLIVGGNVLLYLPKGGNVRVFPLDRYVVNRDPEGNVLEIIVLEKVSRASLDDDTLAVLGPSAEVQGGAESKIEDNVEIYTRLYRDGRFFRLYQEIDGKRIPGTEGKWPLEKSPMIPLRWTRIDNEDYGRSYVEEYLGDLISLEGLSKAIVESAAASAKVVFLLNPNGVTRALDITKAESGDVITGTANDVSVMQAEKFADMRIAFEASKTITERLSFAFLLNSSVQRNAERVTAEEIRYMAGELEDALGGVYSILSQEFQLPLVNRIMDQMTKAKKLPQLPKGVVKPAIVTGLEALGRGHDLNKYQLLIQALQPLGPEIIAKYMNPSDYITRIGTSLGIEMDGLVKTEEAMAQEAQQAQQAQQQQQMMDMAGKAAPQAVSAMSDMAQNPDMQAALQQAMQQGPPQ